MVGATESEPDVQIDALLQDSVMVDEEDNKSLLDDVTEGQASKEMVEKPPSRVTEADEKGDVRSLNRKLARTLYLVVKGKQGGWEFPTAGILGKEPLHRVSREMSGQDFIDAWLTLYRLPSA